MFVIVTETKTQNRLNQLKLSRQGKTSPVSTSLPGDHRALVPPDPIPNSEVKRCIADGSVGFPHVRVGHRQALISKSRSTSVLRDFFWVGQGRYTGAALLFRPDAARGRHVKPCAPQVRGLGAAGVPKELRPLVATHSRSSSLSGCHLPRP